MPTNIEPESAESGSVPLVDVLRFLWRAKWALALGAVVGAAVAYAIGMALTPTYRVDAVLMVVTPTESRAGSLGGQIGGLASLVGLDIGVSTSKGEALQMLRSQYLTRKFIERYDLMPILFPREWDSARGAWRTELSGEPPSLATGVKKFRERVARASEDKQTGMIVLSVTWPDGEVAAKWANDLVAMANEELRDRAVAEAQRSIEFLSSELRTTPILEVRDSMFRLMDGHMRTIMVAKTRADFALRTVDPAVSPDPADFVKPRRVVLALIGTIVGTLLALLAFAVWIRRDLVGSAPTGVA